jgi:NAD(P)-dependent dehydrogenase (short-subunit alcohol dehydrogenase family)
MPMTWPVVSGWPRTASIATNRGALNAFFATIGSIDHLVLAAGPGAVGVGPFAALDEAALRQAFDGKFFAHVKAIQAALP